MSEGITDYVLEGKICGRPERGKPQNLFVTMLLKDTVTVKRTLKKNRRKPGRLEKYHHGGKLVLRLNPKTEKHNNSFFFFILKS